MSRLLTGHKHLISSHFPSNRSRKAHQIFFKTIMNTQIVSEASRATLAWTLPFPEIVGKLMETGVEYYHVDYVALRKTFYSATGDTVITPITYGGLPQSPWISTKLPSKPLFRRSTQRSVLPLKLIQTHGARSNGNTRCCLKAACPEVFALQYRSPYPSLISI